MKHFSLSHAFRMFLLGAVFCAFFCGAALASDAGLSVYGDVENAGTVIRMQEVSGQNYLYLPSTVDPSGVVFCFEGDSCSLCGSDGTELRLVSGQPVDLTQLAHEDLCWQLTLKSGDQETAFTLMISENVSTMYLVSADPESKGRAYIEASADHSAKAKGSMVLLNADGETVYDGALSQIKGRGNSTWSRCEKKPYAIKLSEKTDLLSTGDDSNLSKNWVLLADAMDASLVRNAVALDFAQALGITESAQYEFIALYYDGEYRGSYLLTEKTEVASGRVEITDLDEANEEANPDYDYDDPQLEKGTTSFGTPCQYVTGTEDPEDISGGYLLEMEQKVRCVKEVSWFQTGYGDYIYTSSPEYASRSELEYVADLYQQFEDAVYNGGTNPTTGKSWTEYMDADSLARVYLVLELTGTGEAFFNSTYFQLDAGSSRFTAGPLWDFDLSCTGDAEGIRSGKEPLGNALLKLPDFCELVRHIYTTEFLPLLQKYTAADGVISSYADLLTSSAAMNYTMWPYTSYTGKAPGGDSFSGNTEYVRQYLETRTAFFTEFLTWLPNAFQDVSFSDWYCLNVLDLVQRGILTGTTADTFSPNGTLTRGQTVTILYRMAGSPSWETDSGFADVSQKSYYAAAVSWAVQQGIVTGMEDGLFHPKQSVTREQLAVMLWRYAGSPASEQTLDSFKDADHVHSYARRAMRWCVEKGLFSGSESSTLRSGSAASRAETARIVDLFLQMTDQQTAEPDTDAA